MKIYLKINRKKLVKLKKQKADNNIGPEKLILYILLNKIYKVVFLEVYNFIYSLCYYHFNILWHRCKHKKGTS
jgi:hypothetical protein